MKKLFYLFIVILIAGCSPVNKKELISGIILENMDTAVRPGNDFFSYVNGTWVRNTEIPADKSSYDVFAVLDEASEENVKVIIEESASGDFEAGSDEQKVGDLFQSYMDMEKRNEIGIAPLKAAFEKIQAIADQESLAVYIAYANKNSYPAPFDLTIFPDLKDPSVNTVYLYQAGLGLPDREYYLKDDERSIEIRAAYLSHIEKMFGLARLPDGKKAAESILDLETTLAKENLTKEESRNLDQLYNMIAVEKLPDVMPDFNWNGYLAETGLDKLEKLGVLSIDYLGALNDIMKETSLDIWKVYLTWGVIDANAGRLNAEMDEADFAFYSKELRGTEEQRPMWRRGTSVVNRYLGEVIGKVYVKRHFPRKPRRGWKHWLITC